MVEQCSYLFFQPQGVAFKNQNGGGQQFNFFASVCGSVIMTLSRPVAEKGRREKKWRWGSKNVFSIMSVCMRAAEILGHCKLIKKHHTALARGRK